MRRAIVVVVVCVAAGVAAAAVAHPRTRRPPAPGAAQLFAPDPKTRPAAEPPPLTAAQIRSTATRWVNAMWTRLAGRGPFEWLDGVADITSPDLLAGLRNARATLDDQLTISVTVDIDAVYPSAVDPNTVTVTCVAHRRTTAGPVDQPCATTVTVQASADGRPTVTAVQ